jgi:hypothetical protein
LPGLNDSTVRATRSEWWAGTQSVSVNAAMHAPRFNHVSIHAVDLVESARFHPALSTRSAA